MSQKLFIAHQGHREGKLVLDILGDIGHTTIDLDKPELSEDVAAVATVFVPVPAAVFIPSRYLRVFPSDQAARLEDLEKRGIIVPLPLLRAHTLVGIKYLDENFMGLTCAVHHLVSHKNPQPKKKKKMNLAEHRLREREDGAVYPYYR